MNRLISSALLLTAVSLLQICFIGSAHAIMDGCMATGASIDCTRAQPDSDGDGVPDHQDYCPNDPTTAYIGPCYDPAILEAQRRCEEEARAMSTVMSLSRLLFTVAGIAVPTASVPAGLISLYLGGHAVLASYRPC